jgi:hypothetical protein
MATAPNEEEKRAYSKDQQEPKTHKSVIETLMKIQQQDRGANTSVSLSSQDD